MFQPIALLLERRRVLPIASALSSIPPNVADSDNPTSPTANTVRISTSSPVRDHGLDTAEAYIRCKRSKNSAAKSLAEIFACEPPSTCGDPFALAQIELREQLEKKGFPMILTTEQEARLTGFINFFGDAFAQDRNTDRMHEWLAIIRNEMVDEWCVPVWHKELVPQLDFIDRTLDRIQARRRSTVTHVAANLRGGPAGRYLN